VADVSREYRKDCECSTCITYARVKEYDCGCVEVEIYNDQDPCDDCSNLSNLRESCGQSGSPEYH
jgi:hypothetical protein